MVDIMQYVQQHVRQVYDIAEVKPPHTGQGAPIFTLFGRDQLTVERELGAQLIPAANGSRLARLEELVPCCENWHMGQTMLIMIYEVLYNVKSSSDLATLYHLRQLINRRNVSTDVKHHYHECADFFRSAVEAHVIAAGSTFFDVCDDKPRKHVPPSQDISRQARKKYIAATMEKFVDEFISGCLDFDYLLQASCEETVPPVSDLLYVDLEKN